MPPMLMHVKFGLTRGFDIPSGPQSAGHATHAVPAWPQEITIAIRSRATAAECLADFLPARLRGKFHVVIFGSVEQPMIITPPAGRDPPPDSPRRPHPPTF